MSSIANLMLGALLLTLVFAYGLHLGLNICVNLNTFLHRSLVPLLRRETPHQFVRLPITDYVLGLGSVVLIALVVIPNLGPTCPPERNLGVQANVHMVQLALEAYATDHDGHYPASLQNLTPSYLTAFPRTPWGTQQARGSAIPATFQAPGSLTKWKPLGSGTKADPRLPTDFGAIGYTLLGPNGQYYRLSGTGMRVAQAVIVAYLTNLPAAPPRHDRRGTTIGASDFRGRIAPR